MSVEDLFGWSQWREAECVRVAVCCSVSEWWSLVFMHGWHGGGELSGYVWQGVRHWPAGGVAVQGSWFRDTGYHA